ncbi:MAG: hypothetical protein Unbinned200contig1000_30 [Prokaryotic dsDNA virus sp.]|jgi:hypothetical protein|nr:hypothetical protein [Flavobacteriaceae bacterium]QDP65290.1 MAG: hypothetical protein Unbinned200contig1000_30 [Prokaryotic dsDNA virus sp.]|tara:strand:+ start:38603 stop:39055 length:453 start_codon:yes stop_codon:yes gene_type:complete
MSESEKINRRLSRILSLPVLGILIFFGFIPLVFPILSHYEGKVFPVVKNVDVQFIEKTDKGIRVFVSFDKVRACEFIGLSWYDSFGERSPILFQPDSTGISGEIPITRPVLRNQRSGPWEIIGIDELDGSIAITSHRCHPLWITYTRFYP